MLLSIALALQALTTSFDVSGVHVILRQNSANNVVAANLYLLGGARQVTEANAGIEPILLDVSERGTRQYPKNALRRAMAKLGSEIVIAPSADWTMFGIRSSTEVFDSTWSIFADRLMHPTLAKSEIGVAKAQYLSGIRQRRDDPDALADLLADSITFVGHPYAVSVGGNEKSILAIDSAALRDYQRTQFVTSRMLLVVVGNIDRAHIERLVSKSIGQLSRGGYGWTPPPRVPESQTAVVVARRQLPTNYILGYYSGPLAKGEDYQALRVATSVLTGRMFAEIRTRQNLTYDVHAPFVDRAATVGGLYVTTVSPDTTLKLMRAAVVDLQQGMLDPAGLKQLEEQFITEYFLDNETNAAQADFLARSQLYGGDYREADRFVDELKSVTPEAVQRVARKYMKGFRFAYVGDPSKLNPRTISLF
ncbi:MAG: peptidase domain protein [Gemmatimonadales bacterium]|jgi:zinc protease|nr:peptidase domain protein [Gemmatimonadales bacterium]